MEPRSLHSIEADSDMPRYSNLVKLAYEHNKAPGLLRHALWPSNKACNATRRDGTGRLFNAVLDELQLVF